MNDPLFETLCSKETLTLAWERVRKKHTVGGIDRQTVEKYIINAEKNISHLSEELLHGKYIQQPYLAVSIPKNENERRQLGLLTINDKIVQTAASFVLTPIFEKSFLSVSYAYRRKKSAVQAIRKIQQLIAREKYTWLASCDIDNFFDTIPHQLLFKKISSFLKSPSMVEMIKMFVTMGKVNKHFAWKDNFKGIPQGGVISPMLANFYLYLLDKLMIDNQYGFVRYADDFIILGRNKTEAQQALDKAISLLTNHLQLKLNDGSKVIPVEKGFEFLGIVFHGAFMSLSERKYKRLVSKMLDASNKGQGFITTKLLEVIKGILVFYAKLIPQETLCLLDEELMAILRNKAELEHCTNVQKQKLIKELTKIEFFAKQHNFKRKEYIESEFAIQRVRKNKGKEIANKSVVLNSKKAVNKRKHEYQKLETAGFDLIIASSGTWLGKHENKIIVKHKGTIVQEVPLVNLKNITIQNEGVVFSSNVIAACAEFKVSIDFLSYDGKPYAILHQPDWFDASIGIAQIEAYQNGKCYYIVKQMITGKISNQINLLKYYGKYYNTRIPLYKEAMKDAISTMKIYINEVFSLQENELDNFRSKVFAFEGLAASKYWETIGILINTRMPFERRERQGATDLINCMLNYGYGILYAKITEALIRARLNPNLSYLHKPEHNRPSLVFDLIEEFRQQSVDKAVFALIMKNNKLKCENGLLDDITKKILAAKVIERLNTIEVFREKEMRLFEIINQQAQNLVKFLIGERLSYRPYIRKW